jgi:hypothetical protein
MPRRLGQVGQIEIRPLRVIRDRTTAGQNPLMTSIPRKQTLAACLKVHAPARRVHFFHKKGANTAPNRPGLLTQGPGSYDTSKWGF